MLTVAFGLTLGLLALAYLVTGHPARGNPGKYGAAGGLQGLHRRLEFLSMMGFIMAAIVGSTAGSQDIDSGVFRDLAATGRSRSALFLARCAAPGSSCGSILAIALAFDAAAAFALADGTAHARRRRHRSRRPR